MNNTVTLSQLITRLAKATGVDNNTARRFLRSFFDTIEEKLEAGQSVTIENLGTFRRTDPSDPGDHSGVSFKPDASLLAELNRPFDMFEAVELADGVEFDEPKEPEPAPEPEPVIVEVPEPEPEPEPEPVVVEEKVAITPEPVKKETPKPGVVLPDENDPVFHFADDEDEETEEQMPTEIPESKRRVPMWVWVVVFVVLAGIIGYVAATISVPMPTYDYEDEETVDETLPDTVAAPATIVEEVPVEEVAAVAPASPEPAPVVEKPASAKEPVYDTVEVSLIRLAKKHYGVAEFWVYIFDANRDKIKNPNTIRPGTRVVIPDRSTIPGATKEEAKALAKKKQAEYNRQF